MGRIKEIAGGVLLLLLAIGGGTCTVMNYRDHDAFAREAVEAIATVDRLEGWEWVRGGRTVQHKTFHHHVTFDGHEGLLHLVDQQLSVGDRLRVLYVPSNPSRVVPFDDEHFESWGLWDWAWRVGGTLLLLLGAIGAFLPTKKPDPPGAASKMI